MYKKASFFQITEKGITDHNAGVEKSNVTTQESETTEPAQRSTSVVVSLPSTFLLPEHIKSQICMAIW